MLVFLGSLYSSFFAYSQLILLDFVFSLMLFVMVFVLFLIFAIVFNNGMTKFYNFNNKVVEFWCGLIPIMILLVQVVYSYELIYYDSLVTNSLFEGGSSNGLKLDVKVTGRQWFWTYEYLGMGSWMKFESYMLGVESAGLGDLRLLEVDNRLVLPAGVYNRVNITSGDVIHSWFLPFYGYKLDAIPGVVNTHLMRFDVVGVYYGMCSEICGAGHSYMPIVVEVVPGEIFFMWVEDYKHKYDIATRLGDWYKSYGVSSFI